jgi:uncharacterized protein DUF5681
MAWEKGKSGNPGGRTKEKVFTEQLRIAVNTVDAEGIKKLRRIADKLADCAVAGESWAIQQVADRLDGKPAQESTVTIDDKRDATDWTRAELVAFLDDARTGSDRAAEAGGRAGQPDKVH